jgi:hypothetical protein
MEVVGISAFIVCRGSWSWIDCWVSLARRSRHRADAKRLWKAREPLIGVTSATVRCEIGVSVAASLAASLWYFKTCGYS